MGLREVIGVDAGGTWVKAGRFDENLREIARVKIASGAREGKPAYLQGIFQAVRELNGGGLPAGLSLPGAFNKDRSRVLYLPNVAGLVVGGEGIDIQADIASGLEAQVRAENDANCAALGEWALGWGERDRSTSLLHITWGTGIGTGFVTGGVTQHGWEGGHLPLALVEDKWILREGASLEKNIAVPALLEKSGGMTSEGLLEKAEQGDARVLAVLDPALAGMAWALHLMALMVYPDITTLGGGFFANDWLVKRLREETAKRGQGVLADSLKAETIHRARLGNDAGMIGAAMLALGR